MVAIDNSWSEEANLLFLDNPIGVGFSNGPTKIVNEG